MAISRFRGFLGGFNAFHGVRNIFSHSRTTETTNWKSSQHDEAARLLSRRIYSIGDPAASLVPVLDQWAREGNQVSKFWLSKIIKELRSFKRHSQALQISMWMSEKMNISLDPRDISLRLDLISKVNGVEAAENYYNYIPTHQRTIQVYGALLNCYANAKCVEKAENVAQMVRDLGLTRELLMYNTLLDLYRQTCNYEKMESLTQEMEENQIRFNSYTYCVLINACAAKSDTSKIDEVLKKAESDDDYGIHWFVYVTAAEGYMKAGLADKAVMSLRNAEKFITRDEKKSRFYEFLITLYAKAGYKDDVMRIWGVYKKNERVLKSGYVSIIPSLLRFDDIEGAEKVLEEWKSEKFSSDIRVPNYLIGYHSRKGFMEKAEAIIEEMISRGVKLNVWTWYYMANGYLQVGKSQEAVEAVKKTMKAATVVDVSRMTLNNDVLESCLKFLKEEGNIEEAEEFVSLLERKGFASPDVYQRLLQYIREENPKPNPNLFGESEESSEA